MTVLTKLGTVNLKVAVAPFQIPSSLGNYGGAVFVNGSDPSLPSLGGYWGLNYIYRDQQLTTEPQNPFGIGNPYSLYGGVVQSFGIYDFAACPGPVPELPFQGGISQDYSKVFLSQGPGFLNAILSFINVGYPISVGLCTLPLPNLQFENIKQGPGTGYNEAVYNCLNAVAGNVGGGAYNPVLQYPGTGQVIANVPVSVANVRQSTPPPTPPFSTYASEYVIAAPVSGALQPQQLPVLVNGLGIVNLASTTVLGGLAFSPKYYNLFGRFGPGQLLCAMSIFTELAFATDDDPFNNVDLISFDDDDINTLMGVGQNGSNQPMTCTPDGDFLVQPWNEVVSNTMVLIKGDMTGYYVMNISGAPSLPGYAYGSGGFGADTSGNLWGFVGGVLYSSLGLNHVILNGFPDVTAQSVGCRENACWPWFG